VVPVLPVPLVACAVLAADAPLDEAALTGRVTELAAGLQAAGAVIVMPKADWPDIVATALRPLVARQMIVRTPEGLAPAPDPAARTLLAFHAAPVQQILDAVAAMPPQPDSAAT
jgi:glycerol-3-phosphate O-acyltransferase